MDARWLLPFAVVGLTLSAPCQAKESAGENIPRALEFLPPPPAENSADFARDKEVYQQTRSETGSERWQQATFDADINNNYGLWFQDSFGVVISKEKTPVTHELMVMTITQIVKAGDSAKEQYMRQRPFMYYDAAGSTCAPGDEESLRKNGSYPSGHSAIGWGMALVLSELAPDRQNAILKRGYDFGQSRVICGVHWQSDVEAGRAVAAASLAHLHSCPEFNELLAKAGKEIEQIRQQTR